MLLIGSIEQFRLSGVLGRLETHLKTGLLFIQQGRTCVELYFREGQLMCIGPVRTSASLGERLLQDGVISQYALQETLLAVGPERISEVNIAITLVNLGHATKEQLREWSKQKALDVLQVLLAWKTGDIYFEDDSPTPSGRLLAAFSISSLLTMVPQLETPSTTQPSTHAVTHQLEQASPSVLPAAPFPDISRVKTLIESPYPPDEGDLPAQESPSLPSFTSEDQLPFAAESLVDSPAFISRSSQTRELDSQPLSFQASEAVSQSLSSQALFDIDALPSSLASRPAPTSMPMSIEADDAASFSSLFADASESSPTFPFAAAPQASQNSFVPPQQITIPMPSRYMDTSYMRPDMVLMPLDLSTYREQNIFVALTPDQWRLLTIVDGRTSLQTACRDLSMSPDLLCQVAGELAADRLIQLVLPATGEAQEFSPDVRESMTTGLGNGYGAPDYAASAAQPWNASGPFPPDDVLPQFPSAISFEARSQWGNGGNGASFVPGRGWLASPQPLQPLSPSNIPSSYNGSYAQIGGSRQ